MKADPYAPTSGDAALHAQHYDLRLQYKVATNRLDAEAVIQLEALAPLSEIHLDLVGLTASKVRLSGEKRTRFPSGSAQAAHHADPDDRGRREVRGPGALLRTATAPQLALGPGRLGGTQRRRPGRITAVGAPPGTRATTGR